MSLLKSFGCLTVQTRSYISARSLHPKKFTSILSGVPTKPASAWQIYLTENIQQYKNDNGRLDLKTATQQLSQKWKNMSEHEKQPFTSQFEAKLEAHHKALDEVMRNTTPKEFAKENELRKKYNLPKIRDPRQPKRPRGAFFLYIDHLRANKDPIVSSGSITEQVVEAAKKFKQLSPEESKMIQDKAAAELADYRAAREAYVKQT